MLGPGNRARAHLGAIAGRGQHGRLRHRGRVRPAVRCDAPTGSYTAYNSIDAIEIWNADESLGLLAFKNPVGFTDPCDEGSVYRGRYDIGPGADAVVAYFRQDPGFTVVSSDEAVLDGRRAIHLIVEAKKDYACPGGNLLGGSRTRRGTGTWASPLGSRQSLRR